MGLKFLLGQMKVGLDKISRDTKAGVPNTDSQKGMLLYYQFQCRQKKYPIPYRNNLPVWFKRFCSGTSYCLHYKCISFCGLSTVGVPNNLRTARSREDETRNARRNANRNPRFLLDCQSSGLFSKKHLKKDI